MSTSRSDYEALITTKHCGMCSSFRDHILKFFLQWKSGIVGVKAIYLLVRVKWLFLWFMSQKSQANPSLSFILIGAKYHTDYSGAKLDTLFNLNWSNKIKLDFIRPCEETSRFGLPAVLEKLGRNRFIVIIQAECFKLFKHYGSSLVTVFSV